MGNVSTPANILFQNKVDKSQSSMHKRNSARWFSLHSYQIPKVVVNAMRIKKSPCTKYRYSLKTDVLYPWKLLIKIFTSGVDDKVVFIIWDADKNKLKRMYKFFNKPSISSRIRHSNLAKIQMNQEKVDFLFI